MDNNVPPVWFSNDRVRRYQIESPVRLTFCGNFTPSCKLFDITERRASMKRDILNAVLKRTESQMGKNGDNPLYEDPRDVVGEKPQKPPRKRTVQAIATLSPRNKDKTILKEQKRKLAKKYEGLIMTLMERCEENVVLITDKNSHITKLKEKLKIVLEYNKQFAQENDQLKEQYSAMLKYVDECKDIIKEERERNRANDERRKELEDKIKEFNVPDRDHGDVTTIPLVEVCMNCSSRQILLNQAKDNNLRLQKDMQALKDVLYRLNVQLSRYQEKVRTNIQSDTTEPVYRFDKYDGYDSLITASLGVKQDGRGEGPTSAKGTVGDHSRSTKVVDVTGLLSAQALAPLFDAYQENLQEKDNLITDYEKQFENMNKKSKQIVEESKSLNEKVTSLEEELVHVRQSYKKLIVEKETSDIEKASLMERADRAENKLKEVYELYEDKMSALARDYETVHREYFTVKSALEASAGRSAALEALRARTVPADLHERRLDHCKRLLEELKHQYSMDDERKTDKMNKTELQLKALEDKYNHLCQEHEVVKGEFNAALKNVRQRLKAASARVTRVRRSARLKRSNAEPLKQALDKLERIKHEIKAVKTRAYSSLEELERRIVEQERRASLAQRDHRRELQRAHLALQHKEAVIRSLMDKVADVEEVRLSQTNAHRLQGIVSDSSDRSENSASDKDRHNEKLVQGSGGYYKEKDKKKISKT